MASTSIFIHSLSYVCLVIHTKLILYFSPPSRRYVQARMPSTRTKLLLPTVQAIFLLWALLCAVSRITDHRHHWWDVLAGSIFGTISAILTVSIWSFESLAIKSLNNSIVFQCIYLCNRFERKRNAVEMVHQNGNDERHTSVRRLLSERNKDEVTLNHVVVPWIGPEWIDSGRLEACLAAITNNI